MNASDPAYRVVVAMAENLVPDVCALVMGFLEDIHIELGRQKWIEKMGEINKEHTSNKLPLTAYHHYKHLGYLTKSIVQNRGFMFNWRDLGIKKGWISNVKGYPGCKTPDNY